MILVCDNYKKDEILKGLEKEPLKQIKFFNKSDFIKSFYFDYNNKTVYELCKNFKCNYDTALIYLKNLYYIEDKVYNNEKLDKLVSIKKYLEDNNLLIIDSLFRDYLKSEEVIFDSLTLTHFDEIMINEVKKITDVDVIPRKYQNYEPTIYEFNSIDDEVEYVAFKICELLDSGIAPSKIKIAGANIDYDNSLNRIFKMYNLKLPEEHTIFSTKTVKMFIDNYQSDIKKTIELLKNNKLNNDIIDKIIDVINKYNFITDYTLVKKFIISDLKNIKIIKHFENEIEIIDIMNSNITDEYVFYLNYNQESIPKIHLDKDYITDDIRYLTKLENIEVLNKLERINIKKALKNIKNLTITYKLKSPFASFTKANIFDIESKRTEVDKNTNYSTLSNRVNVTKMLDNLIKYGEVDSNLSLFNKHYKTSYNSYNNKYQKIKEQDLYDYLNNELTLSYTSLNDYYKCAFKYYLKYILKVDKVKENITRHIGSIFHYVLEKGLNGDIDINDTIKTYIKDENIELSVKEEFFLNKLKSELSLILDTIKKQDTYIILKKRLFEQRIEIEYQNKININFVGVIDKIMYDDGIYALIDYKTGNAKIDLSLNYYGINMQLAIYLLLASKKFENAKFAGFYLQFILSKLSKSDDISKKESNLKLVGYSNSKYIQMYDKTYQDSSLIKSLKVKNDGSFYSSSKVLTESQIENLINLASDKVSECIDSIVNTKFDINPKNIDGINVGCEFCDYKDICFKTNKDVVYLEKQEDFL